MVYVLSLQKGSVVKNIRLNLQDASWHIEKTSEGPVLLLWWALPTEVMEALDKITVGVLPLPDERRGIWCNQW